MLDLMELEKKLAGLDPRSGVPDIRPVIKDRRETLPRFEKDLRRMEKDPHGFRRLPPGSGTARDRAPGLIFAGGKKYTDIHAPVLAIFAEPHDLGRLRNNDPATRARAEAWQAWDEERMSALAKAFESGVPSARVVRLPHTSDEVVERGRRAARDECFHRQLGAVMRPMPVLNQAKAPAPARASTKCPNSSGRREPPFRNHPAFSARKAQFEKKCSRGKKFRRVTQFLNGRERRPIVPNSK